jgi:hypothetical protein
MKIAVLEIAPEVAVETLTALRDSGTIILGSEPSSPALRLVISDERLPVECEHDPKKPVPVVRVHIAVEQNADRRAFRTDKFSLDVWASPASPRASR